MPEPQPNLAQYEQKPPRTTALQWTGDPDDAAWVVEQFGGTMVYDEHDLVFTFPGEQPEVVPTGTWFALDPLAGVVRYTDQEFTAAWEQVPQARA